MVVEVPAGLRSGLAQEGPSAARWLDRLPDLTAGFLDRWRLRIDGRPMHGVCALVVPVRTAGGAPAALKLSWPHPEARDEHLALEVWAGDGAVRLLDAAPADYVVLLERLDPQRDLSSVPLEEALFCTGQLLARLAVKSDLPFVGVHERARDWATELANARRYPPSGVAARLLDLATSVLGDLVDSADPVLLHTDLHYENVLAGEREPWLVIDPKPLVGDAAFEVAPLLWNRWDEAVSSADLGAHLRWRADVVAECGGLDRQRVAGWVVVREVVEALDAVVAGNSGFRDMSVAIANAFVPRSA